MIITGMEHFQDVCKKKLVEWYNKSCMIHEGPNAIKPIDLSNVFIVWSCKTLQNYKCLASTTVSGDGIYAEYEITVDYNGVEYSLSDESTYRKYHGRIGQTVSAVLITKTYDNGNVKQYINCLGGL